MSMRDAIVIGAGAAGAKAAALLARSHDVLALEEHPSSGRPAQCAGLISLETAEMSGASPDALGTIYGADVIFPGGGVISIRRDRPIAIAVDRAALDSRLADMALAAGAEISYSERYLGHSIRPDRAEVHTSGRDVCARILIGADGQGSAAADSLRDNRPREYLRGIQADVRHRAEDEGVMTLRLGSDIAPGFFSWEIPMGDTVRAGLCVAPGAPPPSEFLGPLLRRAGLDKSAIQSKASGKIPMGGRRRSFGERLLLIGDAAGQVKPVSGGGLYPIFKAAPLLAEAASSALSSGCFSEQSLSAYERAWRRELGREMDMGYRARRMFAKMSDSDLDRMRAVLGRPRPLEALREIEIDRPSDALRRALSSPGDLARAAWVMARSVL